MKRTATIFLSVIFILSTFLPLFFSSSGGLILSEDPSEELCFVDNKDAYIAASPKTMTTDGYVYFNVTSKDLEGAVDFCVGFEGTHGYPESVEVYDPREEITQFEIDLNTYLNDPLCKVDYNYTTRESKKLHDGFVWANRNMSIVNEKNQTVGWDNVQVLMKQYDVIDLSTGLGSWGVSEIVYWRDIGSGEELEKESFNFQGMDTWYNGEVDIQKNKEYYLRMWLTLVPTLNPDIQEYYVALKPRNKNYEQSLFDNQFYYLDPWFDASWNYRKSHVINNATGAGSYYQVRIEVFRIGDYTYSDERVYCDSKCRTDYGDIRFTDNDGDTLLDYWLEGIHGTYAVFWIELKDDISVHDGIFYMYYGKSVTTTSDFDSTFLFGDPFDSATLDTSRWPTVTGDPDYYIDSSYHTLEVYDIDTYSWWNGKGFRSKFLNLPDSWIIEDAYGEDQAFWMLHYTDSAYDIFGSLFNVEHTSFSTSDYGIAHVDIRDHWGGDTDYFIYAGVGGNGDYNGGTQTYSGYVLKDFKIWKLDGDIHIEIDDTERVDESNSENEYYVHLGLSRYAYYTFGLERFSAFKVRKYVSPEPIHGDWGSEQQWYYWQDNEYASLVWGTGYYPVELGDTDEYDRSEELAEIIYDLFDMTGRYDNCSNFWGSDTQPDSLYEAVENTEDNYDYTTVFYKGHILPLGADCTNQNCPFNPPPSSDIHQGIYDYEGLLSLPNGDPICDWAIHERLNGNNTGFLFIWTCDHGSENKKGDYFNSHSRGLIASWLNATDLVFDGYSNSDESDRCFISFSNLSLNFIELTEYDSWDYGDFLELFYYYALSGGVFSIKNALDLAAADTHGGNSFGNCQLYLGYERDNPKWPDWGEEKITSYMRVWGDVDHVIPS